MTDSNPSAEVLATSLPTGGKEKSGLTEKLPSLIALATSLSYGMGFLVWTSYLASKGVSDLPLVSARYVFTGALMAFIATAYYFFVWRKMARRVAVGIAAPPGISKRFLGFLNLYFIGEDITACCFVAAWLAGFLMPYAYAEPVQITALMAFAIDKWLFRKGAATRWPRAVFAISFILQVVCNIFYVIYAIFNPPLLAIFSLFVTMTILGSVILTSGDLKSERDRYYAIFYFCSMLLVAVATFGSNVFGHISAKYGGGELPRVQVLLAQELDDTARKALASAGDRLFLLVDTDNMSTFEVGAAPGQTTCIRLDHKMVRALVFQPPQPLKQSPARMAEVVQELRHWLWSPHKN